MSSSVKCDGLGESDEWEDEVAVRFIETGQNMVDTEYNISFYLHVSKIATVVAKADTMRTMTRRDINRP